MKSDKSPKAPLICHAKSKTTGKRCRNFAVKGWKVCRFHGAGGGSKRGVEANAYKHGLRTAEAIAARKKATQMRRDLNALLKRNF